MADPDVGGHWFEALADHMGDVYLRYAFTKGTQQEVDSIVSLLDLERGMRVLDVGCGPGRHAHALAERGMTVVGVDISSSFIATAKRDAPPGATFLRADARTLTFEAEFDVCISLCQGAFGLTGGPNAAPIDDPDLDVLAGMARALRPGGKLFLSAFSAYFQMRFLEDSDHFDAASGVNHEHTGVHDADGNILAAELWTTCYTPRELRLMCTAVGLEVLDIWAATPGRYAPNHPSIDQPEFLLHARRPLN